MGKKIAVLQFFLLILNSDMDYVLKTQLHSPAII